MLVNPGSKPMRFLTALFSLILLLPLAACGDDPAEPENPTLNGRFVGNAFGVQVDLSLSESAGDVSGTGTLVVPTQPGASTTNTIPVTITGTHNHPNVSLTARSQGQPDATFAGQFTGNATVSGTLTLQGFPGVPLTLTRQ